jgi:hypothetical protein
MVYPAKLSFKTDRGMKVFHDKQKLKQYMTTKPPLQKILQGILHTEDESKQNHERMGSIKLQEKKRQVITTCLSILTLNVNGLNSSIKRHCLAN